jgi:hypothetical protein
MQKIKSLKYKNVEYSFYTNGKKYRIDTRISGETLSLYYFDALVAEGAWTSILIELERSVAWYVPKG